MSLDSETDAAPSNRTRFSAAGVVGEAIDRIVRDPRLALPFALAGVFIAAVDWLRLRDPIPTGTPDTTAGDVSISIAFRIYPSGVRATDLPVGALVDLRPPYLARALGLELGALLAVGVAGWLTLARATGTEPTTDQLVSYLGLVVAVRVLFRVFAAFDGIGILTWVAFIALTVLFAYTLLVPVLLLTGSDLRTAVGRSASHVSGHGAPAFGIVLVVGLAGWLLGSVPTVGTALSYAVVAPIHAVTIVAVAKRLDVEP